MSDRQQELYQQVILEHNRKPRNYGELAGATHKAEGYNPLCGDHIWVELNADTDQVHAAHFHGDGCAICKASASMMTAAITGKPITEVKTLVSEFKAMVKGELDPATAEHSLGRLKIFSGIWRYPARVKCAILAWYAIEGALNNETSVTTE